MTTITLGENVNEMADAFGNVSVSIIPLNKLGSRDAMDYAQHREVPVEKIIAAQLLGQTLDI